MNSNFEMAALYVGNLHANVTEPMLEEKFSPAGPIHSIRLCRDRKTGSSLGYTFIDFHHQADAERALEMLNFERLMGQPMRIMWSQRDSWLRNTGIGNLFIKNLDKAVDSVALFDTFSLFGKILSCKVVRNEKRPAGYGYVRFESAKAADLVKERLNGKLLNGRKVFIEHFKSREERMPERGQRPQVLSKIFIKNFGEDMDNKKLKDIFRKFGSVVSVRVISDENGKSRRFGFIKFVRNEDAQRAVDEMNGKELNGRTVYVGQAQSKAERQSELRHKHKQGLNLYVKNLDVRVDDECLRTEFLKFGAIINAKVMTENGRSKGFGFVRFASPEEAVNAIKGMNGRMWGRKPLYVAVAQGKEERQAYLTSQNIQPQSAGSSPPQAAVEVPVAADDAAPQPAAAEVPAPQPAAAEVPTPQTAAAEVPAPESAAAEVPAPEPAAAEVPAPQPAAAEAPAPQPAAAEVPAPQPAAAEVPAPQPAAAEVPALVDDEDPATFTSTAPKVEFTLGEESEKPSKKDLGAEELSKSLEWLIQDKANNQRIHDWVEANLDEQQMTSSSFVRALITCVCQVAIICENPYKVEVEQITQRAKLLQKYLVDEQKELQALYALQALMVRLEQPAKLLRNVFYMLYDEDVIQEETFYKWESSKDPAEQVGKDAALRSIRAFLTWLQEAEYESDNS